MSAKIAKVWNGSEWVNVSSPVIAGNSVVAYQPSAPLDPITGQIWINDSTKVVSVWSGSAWIPTSISASDITTGTLAVSRGGTGTTTSTGSGSVVLSGSPTFSGSITASNANFTGSLTANSGWGGTNSSAGALGGIPMAFDIERNGTGSANGLMSFGNGATTIKGARMPFSGKLITATLHGTGVTGTITVDAYINGSANTSYRLSGTGSASDVNVTQNWQLSPLSFSAGSTINFRQTSVPTSANGYVVTFFVVYD
jgi:hypothetical protein